MKSPLYFLAVLLSLATELTVASPTAEPDNFDFLEERTGSGGGGGRGRRGSRNPCRIRNQYSYWKYLCDSSDRMGQENPGDQFSASCRYRNWYQTQKGWVRQQDRPQGCNGGWDHPC